MASYRAAAGCRRLLISSDAFASPRFYSTATSRFSSPRFLGYFHHPGRMRDLAGSLYPTRMEPGVRFEPHAAAASPTLSLDFLPGDAAVNFNLVDSHSGLLLLFHDTAMVGSPTFLVCDPLCRSHLLLPKMPASATEGGGVLVGAALLSRADNRFEFDAVFMTVHRERLRPWVASVRDSECHWGKLPWAEVAIDFNRVLLEQRCVHAAGSLYFHICGSNSALALNASTRQVSYLHAPNLIWDDFMPPKYRIGETPAGDLCVASIENGRLLLCVQGMSSHDGWVLEKDICLRDVLDAISGLPEHPSRPGRIIWLSDIDGGHTGRVFIRTTGCGRFSYHLDTGKLDRLMIDDGMEYGDPIFAYFSSLDDVTEFQ